MEGSDEDGTITSLAAGNQRRLRDAVADLVRSSRALLHIVRRDGSVDAARERVLDALDAGVRCAQALPPARPRP